MQRNKLTDVKKSQIANKLKKLIRGGSGINGGGINGGGFTDISSLRAELGDDVAHLRDEELLDMLSPEDKQMYFQRKDTADKYNIDIKNKQQQVDQLTRQQAQATNQLFYPTRTLIHRPEVHLYNEPEIFPLRSPFYYDKNGVNDYIQKKIMKDELKKELEAEMKKELAVFPKKISVKVQSTRPRSKSPAKTKPKNKSRSSSKSKSKK